MSASPNTTIVTPPGASAARRMGTSRRPASPVSPERQIEDPASTRQRWNDLAAAVAGAAETDTRTLGPAIARLEQRLGLQFPSGTAQDDPPVVLARRFARVHAAASNAATGRHRPSDHHGHGSLAAVAAEALELLTERREGGGPHP